MLKTVHLPKRSQIEEIERNAYTVLVDGEDKTVSFYFELLPNDMKYLAFIAGELPISSTYFSPFADVKKDLKASNFRSEKPMGPPPPSLGRSRVKYKFGKTEATNRNHGNTTKG